MADVIDFEKWRDFNDANPDEEFIVLDPDPGEIAAYFDAVFGYCEGWIPLRGFVDQGQGLGGRPHNVWVEADGEAVAKAASFAGWAAKDHAAFYVVPGTVAAHGQAKAADVVATQVVLADIDCGDVAAKLAHLARHLGEPSLVVESGGRTADGQDKLHAYWKLTEPAEGDDLALVCRLRHEIAVKVGADTHFRSAHQPIRVAGSVYHKGGRKRLVSIRNRTGLENDLAEFAERLHEMPALPDHGGAGFDHNGGTSKPGLDDVLITPVREGGQDAWTRFAGASAAIGHYVRLAHEGRMSHAEAWEAICQYNAAMLRPSWPQDRLAGEAQRLWEKHCERNGPPAGAATARQRLETFSLSELLADASPMPEDLIAPRLLTPGGLLVIGGAPKVGKSDFVTSLLVHVAAGAPFLGFAPPRALRVFYLQAEIQYHYLRERMQAMRLPKDIVVAASTNLIATPKVRMLLNDRGVELTLAALRDRFPDAAPEVLCIDPIRNLFDGGPEGNAENDNAAMLFFLQERVEKLREELDPAMGIVLCHHTRKARKKDLEEDPFQALSGAGALRGFYTSGMLLHRPDEERTERRLYLELRNGPAIPAKLVDKIGGRWVELDPRGERLVRKSLGEKLDAERRRKHDVILQLFYDEALEGRVYTANQFATRFENQASLGGYETIRRRLSVLATKGYIKFFRNPDAYGLPPATRSKFGYACVEGMRLGPAENRVDPETGEVLDEPRPVLPTHYKCPMSGAVLPVEDPEVWVYHDDGEAVS